MSDIFEFENFELSARGLMARPILPNNGAALRGDITSIDFAVRDITNAVDIANGSLSPAVVMFTALQKPWRKDTVGYSFLWVIPGNYVPTAGTQVRIKLTFTMPVTHPDPQLQGKSFIMVYQANVKDPLA